MKLLKASEVERLIGADTMAVRAALAWQQIAKQTNYQYVVLVEQRLQPNIQEMRAWLVENSSQERWRITTSSNTHGILFSKDDEALAFFLRWKS